MQPSLHLDTRQMEQQQVALHLQCYLQCDSQVRLLACRTQATSAALAAHQAALTEGARPQSDQKRHFTFAP